MFETIVDVLRVLWQQWWCEHYDLTIERRPHHGRAHVLVTKRCPHCQWHDQFVVSLDTGRIYR